MLGFYSPWIANSCSQSTSRPIKVICWMSTVLCSHASPPNMRPLCAYFYIRRSISLDHLILACSTIRCTMTSLFPMIGANLSHTTTRARFSPPVLPLRSCAHRTSHLLRPAGIYLFASVVPIWLRHSWGVESGTGLTANLDHLSTRNYASVNGTSILTQTLYCKTSTQTARPREKHAHLRWVLRENL